TGGRAGRASKTDRSCRATEGRQLGGGIFAAGSGTCKERRFRRPAEVLRHRTKEASRAGAAQEGFVADPRAHYQRVIQQASVRDYQRALVHAGGSEGCRMCENRTLSGRQCSRRAPVRRRWERETVQSVGRFLCATRTSAIREIRRSE